MTLLRSTEGSISGRSQVIDATETSVIDPVNPEIKKLELQCVQQISEPRANLTCFTLFTSTEVLALFVQNYGTNTDTPEVRAADERDR